MMTEYIGSSVAAAALRNSDGIRLSRLCILSGYTFQAGASRYRGAFFPFRLRCSPALMRQAKAATTSRTALDAPDILHQAGVTITHSRSVSRRYKCRLRPR